MATLHLHYAYPTSTMAAWFGKSKTGCHAVSFGDGIPTRKSMLGGFATAREAAEAGRATWPDAEWYELTRRYHSDTIAGLS